MHETGCTLQTVGLLFSERCQINSCKSCTVTLPMELVQELSHIVAIKSYTQCKFYESFGGSRIEPRCGGLSSTNPIGSKHSRVKVVRFLT